MYCVLEQETETGFCLLELAHVFIYFIVRGEKKYCVLKQETETDHCVLTDSLFSKLITGEQVSYVNDT